MSEPDLSARLILQNREQQRHIRLLQNARDEQRSAQRDADRIVEEILERVRGLQKLRVVADTHAKWWDMQETRLERGEAMTPPTRTTETSINWDGRRI